jgi:hypothetical protein
VLIHFLKFQILAINRQKEKHLPNNVSLFPPLIMFGMVLFGVVAGVHTLLYVQLFTICMMLLSKKQPTEKFIPCRLNLVKEKNSNPCLNDKAGTFCCVEH